MNNKTLLILGGSSDIGLEFIKDSYNEYDRIYAQYCGASKNLIELQQKLGNNVIPIQADFLSEPSINSMIKYLINCAEPITHVLHLTAPRISNVRFKSLSWEMYQKDIDIQIKSIFKVLNTFITDMAKNKYGKIVFMLSSYVVNEPPKYLNSYVAVKYALLGFMKALASEYAEKKININAVSPSMIETKFLTNIPDIVVQSNAENNPMKRNATVDDIIPAIRFLLSDETSYITGQNIIISGGNK
jgi:3-oxoacyl-[acyl-carrier protein] reductase